MEGLRLAKGDIAGFIDVDLEVSPSYILEIINKLRDDNVDAVIGHRYYPISLLSINSLMRFLSTKIYSSIVRNILKLPIQDTESGYKFFKRNKILKVLSRVKDRRWFWDTEIVARSIFGGLRIKEVPVLFLRNPNKTSTVNLFSDTMQYLTALYRFKKSLKPSERHHKTT